MATSGESQAAAQSMGGGSLPTAYAQVGSTQKTCTWEVTVTEVQKPTAVLEPASLNVEAGKEATAQVKVTNSQVQLIRLLQTPMIKQPLRR